MVNKENAKLLIKELIEKYTEVVEEKRVSKYKEEETKKDFILPLFRALGWDVENSLEVTAEETISKKRVDYGFRINGIPKFFLEAKALKADLNDPKFIEQAIDYAWTKGCTWAVLSDFESVIIFNAEWKTEDLLQNLLKSIPCREFLDRFDELWLLSKESFEQDLLDKEAEKWGKKAKLASIDQQLLDDFARWRNALSKNILNYNKDKKLTEEELDETVQRLLNRLVFIRKSEDAELEGKVLLSALREWESDGSKALYLRLEELFRKFRETYDSELFDEALVDEVVITNDVLKEVINGLYKTKDKLRRYDFAIIDADVLGAVYEQYLGHILKKTKKRADVKESHARRKEEGIYYTPTYIVEYIVRNTLGELLKDKKLDVEKIRVLDPACGSGSFLIKAFDILNEHYSKHDKDYSQSQLDMTGQGTTFTRKVKILQDNIFGVDLDKQAVEIARLNLLLKIAEKGQRLPLLRQNIKRGNSLIDDEKIEGDKAFKWEREFPEIVKDGGFDVVVGNPPYVRHELAKLEKTYMEDNFETYDPVADLFTYFIERGINVLKNGGVFAFIVSSKFTKTRYGKKLRRFILDNCLISQFIDFGDLPVFEDATTYPCIIVLRKEQNKRKRLENKIKVSKVKTLDFDNLQNYVYKSSFFVDQDALSDSEWFFEDTTIQKIRKKIESEGLPLKKYLEGASYRGVVTGFNEAFIIGEQTKEELIKKDEKSRDIIKPLIKGREVQRYYIKDPKLYLIFSRRGIDIAKYPAILNHLSHFREDLTPKKASSEEGGRKPGKYEWYEIQDTTEYYTLFEKPKIVYPEVSKENRFSLDYEGYYPLKTCFIIPTNDKYLLGILNSKLMLFYLHFISSVMRGGYYMFSSIYVEKFPIKKASEQQQKPIIKLVEKQLGLTKQLNEIGDKKTDQRQRIEEEIERTDADIDELVYKIYGITEEEKKIIEKSLK